MSLYFIVLIATILGPIALSFDKKVAFYKNWKYLIPSTLIVFVFFFLWDQYFTQLGVWGFNSQYIQGIFIGLLPLEEVLFFILVPYACLFIHEVLKAYFPRLKPIRFAHFFAFTFVLAGFIYGTLYIDRWYTASACYLTSLLTIGFYFIAKKPWYTQFSVTYIVVLVPFLLVNGILTGGFTEEPIVWYNAEHIIGLRIYTIPMEDLFYNYILLLPIVGIYEYLKVKFKS